MKESNQSSTDWHLTLWAEVSDMMASTHGSIDRHLLIAFIDHSLSTYSVFAMKRVFVLDKFIKTAFE